MNKTVALHTLGCKLNFSETSTLSRMLAQEGFARRDFDEGADVYVINTCSVTENADKECRQLVRRIRNRRPDSLVVITGCYAQLQPKEIAAIPGVDLVLGAAEKFNIVDHLKTLTREEPVRICSCDIEEVDRFVPSHSLKDRTRVFLKVQDGCDYNCSFCTIPAARGKSRSDSIDNVCRRAEEIAREGAREIVLTGINLGDFGKGAQGGRKHDENFSELIRALDSIDAVDRFRISSIEPNLLTDEIIDFVAGSRAFMPHFHIPLQSGSNRILGLMKRRYRRELYAEKLRRIRSVMPHCAIGVDVITGFPTETEEDFQDTFRFLQDLDVSYLHVFTYSERRNTPAIDLRPAVPVRQRQERTRLLRSLSLVQEAAFLERHRGQKRAVLFEGAAKNDLMEGYTDNYIKVKTAFDPKRVNQIISWSL